MLPAKILNNGELMRKLKDRIIAILIILSIITVDQTTKMLAVAFLKPIEEVPVLGNLLVLRYCTNTGAAFSMFQNNKLLLIGFTSLFLMVGVVVIFGGFIKKRTPLYLISIVIAGGIGNLIDRLFLGYVTDFIYIKVIDFAIFNFADMCVTIGGTLLVIYLIFFDKEIKNEQL